MISAILSTGFIAELSNQLLVERNIMTPKQKILDCLTKDYLKELAAEYELTGVSQFNKGELVAHPLPKVKELIEEKVLEKIQDGNHGGSHPVASDYMPSGVPFIMSGNIRNGQVDIKNCKFLAEDHAKSLRVGHSRMGDVLLTQCHLCVSVNSTTPDHQAG